MNKMNVLMISVSDMSVPTSLGVTKKIKGQYSAFQELGCTTYNLCFDNGDGVLIHGNKQKIISKRKVKDYFTVIDLFDKAPIICKKLGIDLCYIRYPLADWSFMRMVRRLHKICKVVVEIPTYPYDEQNKKLTNIIARINLFQDKRFRDSIHKYVDRIATFSSDDTIYGTKCINISNGIDINSVKYLGDSLVYDDTINLIGVAKIQRDHGYDKVIHALKEYYKNDTNDLTINLHIVGSGDEEHSLIKLTKENRLENHVFFYGVKSGKELEDIYRKSNIGIGFLAAYRSGLDSISALKTKEYCAIGLPFINAVNDSAISSEFSKKFPNTEEPISINEIISYFEYIKAHPEIHSQMRRFAEENLSWEKQIRTVIETINAI